MQKVQKRIKWLDLIKSIMIILVVLVHSLVSNHNIGTQGHFDTFLIYIIDTFIMPCFFAVSGYLYKRVHNWKQYFSLIRKKLFGLFIPYLWFSVLMSVILTKQVSWNIIYQPVSYLWFLYSLIFIFLIVGTMDLLHIPPIIQLIAYFGFAMFQTKLIWWNGSNFNINPVASVLGYLLFFYIGYWIKQYRFHFVLMMSHSDTLLVSSIFLLLAILIQMKYTGIYPYSTDQISGTDIATKIFSIFVIFGCFTCYGYKMSNWIAKLGRYTLVIYLFHYIIVHYGHMLLRALGLGSPILITIITFALSLILSVALVDLLNHIKFFKPLRIMFYPREIFG